MSVPLFIPGRREAFRQRRSQPRCLRRHRGVAAVEFAVIAPVFFLVLLAMVEFGRMVMVQQVLTNSSRVGARRAIVEGATQAEVVSHVATYLANSSIGGADVAVSPSDLHGVGFGDSVQVTVSVPFSSVSWTPAPWFLGDATLRASTMMEGERLQ